MKIVRSHDTIYLDEDRKNTPKEYFKFLAEYVKPHIESLRTPEIVDIGCATGDFVWYLKHVYPQARIHGVDVMEVLLERARVEVPDATFSYGNIYTGEGMPDEKYDIVFFCGVNSIFDEFEPWVDNLLKCVKSKGRIYIFGIFNPSDLDVLVKTRRSGLDKTVPWQAGWNLISKKSIALYLDKLGLAYRFVEYKIPIDIEPRGEDPLRSWTFKIEDGSRIIVNGTQVLHHMFLLEILAPGIDLD